MIGRMYLTMMCVILGGIFNMIFCKTDFYKKHRHPIDGGKNWKDGKRIFGDHKTVIGFISMIIICMVVQFLYGLLLQNISKNELCDIYKYHDNTVSYNLIVGALFGFSYMICELPNSFIKRRVNIPDGKTMQSKLGMLFFVNDQLDSMFGVMLVLAIVAHLSVWGYIAYVLLGGITHILINLILYKCKIRRNL